MENSKTNMHEHEFKVFTAKFKAAYKEAGKSWQKQGRMLC